MSLVRLLTAGKSLVGIQDSKSRYRSVDPRAMPKFGSEKKNNMEVAGENGVKPSVAKSSGGSSQPNVNVAADKNVRAPQAGKNVGVTAGDAPVGGAREDRGGGGGWVSQLGSKLNSLVSQKPKATRSAIPRPGGVAIQGELSLDNIRVVRNDLSDTDLEVVTKKAVPVEAEVERVSSRAAEFVKRVASSARGATGTGPDARATVTTMFSAVES